MIGWTNLKILLIKKESVLAFKLGVSIMSWLLFVI